MAKVSLRIYNQEIENLVDRGQLDEAIAHCRHILNVYPKYLETYRLLGKAYLEAKKYEDAVDIFQRVVMAVPDDFVAHVGMSIINDERGDLDAAIWHMERAYETQSSNAAIQSELQRLYGRRDGVEPPKIRLTRGALAHMYVQGELYPQAISEIQSVLDGDPERQDMQVLLARSYFHAGMKGEAAEVCSTLLRRYPYCLDANRILVELLPESERAESTQVYRKRVVELDPYAAFVTGTVFHSKEVPDAAVSLERLEWDGQPVSMDEDWGSRMGIGLAGGVAAAAPQPAREEEPGWLKTAREEPPAASTSTEEPAPAANTDSEIPNFLRDAGWTEDTGTFQEGAGSFDDASEEPEPEIEQGELPDWLKAMQPANLEQPSEEPPAEEGEADEAWLRELGLDQPPEEVEEPVPQQPMPGEETSAWLRSLEAGDEASEAETPAAPSADGELPDWLQPESETEKTGEPAQASEMPNWLADLGEPVGQESEQPETQFSSEEDLPDWLKAEGTKVVEEPVLPEEPEQAEPQSPLAVEPPADIPVEEEKTPTEAAAVSFDAVDTGELGTSAEEQDDAFAWLENLAAKHGAKSEELLTKPEERLESEPDWVLKAKSVTEPRPQAEESSEPVMEEPVAEEPVGEEPQIFEEETSAPPTDLPDLFVEEEKPPTEAAAVSFDAVDTGSLGTSAEEQDDAFAWLENLAAKHGAKSEELLTKPEERLESEPDWVQKAKSATEPRPQAEELSEPVMEEPVEDEPVAEESSEPVAEELVAEEPSEPVMEETTIEEPVAEEPQPAATESANTGELGTSTEEQDDAFAWLENLAAKHGAKSEELLTKPEERLESEPEWVQKAKGVGAEVPQAPPEEPAQPEVEEVTPEPEPEMEIAEEPQTAVEAPLEKVDINAASEEVLAELPGIGELLATNIVAYRESYGGFSNVEDLEHVAGIGPDTIEGLRDLLEFGEVQVSDETLNWLREVEESEAEQESAPVAEAGPGSEQGADDLPEWLSEFDSETPESAPQAAAESAPAEAQADDLPDWLAGLDEDEQHPEPTNSTDWHPVEEGLPKAEPNPEEQTAEPEQKPEPEAEKTPEMPPTQTPPPTAEPEPEQKTEQPPAREPYREPITRSRSGMTGMLSMTKDPVLYQAQSEITRGNIPGAMESYTKLIKKGRLLDEVIFDLREMLYRYPVEVSIWQTLGDAYMRSNRLQDALDAYTKAEELLR